MTCVVILVFQCMWLMASLSNSQILRVILVSFHTEVANHIIQFALKRLIEVLHYMTKCDNISYI